MAELFLEHSEHECTDHQAFKEDVDSLVQAARESTVSLSQVSAITTTTIITPYANDAFFCVLGF